MYRERYAHLLGLLRLNYDDDDDDITIIPSRGWIRRTIRTAQGRSLNSASTAESRV